MREGEGDLIIHVRNSVQYNVHVVLQVLLFWYNLLRLSSSSLSFSPSLSLTVALADTASGSPSRLGGGRSAGSSPTLIPVVCTLLSDDEDDEVGTTDIPDS